MANWQLHLGGPDYAQILMEVLLDGTFLGEPNGKHFTLAVGGKKVVFDGDFVIKSGGGFEAGTITGFHVIENGVGTHLDASGYAIDIEEFTWAFIVLRDQGADEPIGSLLVGVPLTVTGSAQGNDIFGGYFGDILHGNGGRDDIRGFGGGDEIFGGRGDDFCLGGKGKDEIDGGKGADTLHGDEGKDNVTGGAGADSFRFGYLGAKHVDTVTDFRHGHDHIDLHAGVFGGIAGEPLDADAFHVGTKAKDAEDRIIYDKDTGKLYFDADGKGGAAQVQFAVLANHATLTADDFVYFM